MAPTVLVLHGPNLNLLGHRDPAQYGRVTLEALDARVAEAARALGAEVIARQSNHEGELVDWLHEVVTGSAGEGEPPAGVVLNPGGLAHTSVVLRDAVEVVVAADVPVIEVHLSNVHAREPYRARLLSAEAASGIVSGLGPAGYELAVAAVLGRGRIA